MPEKPVQQSYFEASCYTEPVDFKKLRFILSALEDYAARAAKRLEDLDVLEVACGVGGVTLAVASLGCRVRAFDIDDGDVACLRNRIEEKGYTNVKVTIDDALSFDDGDLYDVVIASEIFEHVTDPERVAALIRRRMTAGAILILTTPNGYGPWELKNTYNPAHVMRRWDWLRRLMGKGVYAEGAGRDHSQRYTKGRLMRMFSEHSLDLIDFAKSDWVFSIFRPLRRHEFWAKLDMRLADFLPYWMASGWYMVFEAENDR